MPFRSVAQREYLRTVRPDIYRRWRAKYGTRVSKSAYPVGMNLVELADAYGRIGKSFVGGRWVKAKDIAPSTRRSVLNEKRLDRKVRRVLGDQDPSRVRSSVSSRRGERRAVDLKNDMKWNRAAFRAGYKQPVSMPRRGSPNGSFSALNVRSITDLERATGKKVPWGRSGVSKSEASRNSALQGAGGMAALGGLAASGLPGVKPNANALDDAKKGPWDAKRRSAAWQSGKGGILGFRLQAHAREKRNVRREADVNTHKPIQNSEEAFYRGRQKGKIKPEAEVMRHLKRGKAVGHLVTAAGLGALGYGTYRNMKQDGRFKKADDDQLRSVDRYHGALLGAGGAATVGAAGIQSALKREERRWRGAHRNALKAAQKHAPHLDPKMSTWDAMDPAKGAFRDTGHEPATQAGLKRGRATQAKYFAGAYKSNAKAVGRAKLPAAAVAGVGGLGLLLSGKDKQRVGKAFPVPRVEGRTLVARGNVGQEEWREQVRQGRGRRRRRRG